MSKGGMSCGGKCMKWILVIINGMVLVAGAIAIGLGAWAYTSDYGADEMKAITGSSLYESACILVMVGGAIVFVIALFGACGACMESKCLLAIYFSIMILLLILFAVGAVLGFFYRDDLRDRLEDEMEDTLVDQYNVDEDGNSEQDHPKVTDVWDKIQEDLECCGVSGDLNSRKSWFLWQSSRWFQTRQPALAVNRAYVPNSCCNIKGGFTVDQCIRINSNSAMPIQTDIGGISQSNPALFHKGCVDALEDKIEDHIIAIAAIAVVVLAIMVCCVFFSICLFVNIRNKNEIV